MIITTHSPEETIAAGERLAGLLRGGDLLAYTGGMGAGKTTFTIGLARGLGLDAWVSSPTFALVHEYEGKLPLCHFDMFRITTPDDLYSTGFFDYLDSGRVIAVEWSENIASSLPSPHITVSFDVGEGDTRIITVTGDERF
ncbi:MAG: tRNA (adenosine(37)-N6)-threonylcarbamoyltransferase complex ATPase subunit type 1 TsaE [Angelakisella sp.]